MHPKKMKGGKKKELLIFLYKAPIKPQNKLSLPLPVIATILQIRTLPHFAAQNINFFGIYKLVQNITVSNNTQLNSAN